MGRCPYALQAGGRSRAAGHERSAPGVGRERQGKVSKGAQQGGVNITVTLITCAPDELLVGFFAERDDGAAGRSSRW